MGLFDDLEFPDNPKTAKSVAPIELKHLPIINRPYVEYTDGELYQACGERLTFDVEIYPNYFLLALRSIKTHKVITFELTPDKPAFDELEMSKLWWVLQSFTLISFNGINFDIPIITLAAYGRSIQQMKEVADKIIELNKRPKKGEKGYNSNTSRGYRPRDIEKEYDVTMLKPDHIDLIEVAPMQQSLKIYHGRNNGMRMQDLPYDPAQPLSYKQAIDVRFYCVNDLDATEKLYETLLKEIKLREKMSEEYGIDLRSLSDAQIAEHVLITRCSDELGYRPKRPSIAAGTEFYYEPPAYMKFKTEYMQNVFNAIVGSPFRIKDTGQPFSDYLKPLDENSSVEDKRKSFSVTIGKMRYVMGIGGLHSTEKKVAHWADDEHELFDSDVASYYPSMIINNKYAPAHLGKAFLFVYTHIVNDRLEAKGLAKSPDKTIAADNKTAADSLKIVINGTFGKLGSKYSNLYSPHLLVQVTVTGQLSLLMLIETLELEGIQVVSANTDGIVVRPHKSQATRARQIIKEWEAATSLEMEETQYKGILSRDVNNYIAIKKNYVKGVGWTDEFPEGTPTSKMYKGKGVFGDFSLRKAPNCNICAKAISEFLITGKPVEETIRESRDIFDFVVVKNVKGGAHKDGWALGKAVRFYYGEGTTGTINYVMNGNTVGSSEGGYPCMDIPDEFPTNIDYDKYVNLTEDMLAALGYYGDAANDHNLDLFDEYEAMYG